MTIASNNSNVATKMVKYGQIIHGQFMVGIFVVFLIFACLPSFNMFKINVKNAIHLDIFRFVEPLETAR